MAAQPPTPLLILYGSQTGNAQDVAERIGREAARRHYAPRVLPCDAYLPLVAQLPAQPVVLFVASTTGQGDTPDSMRALWKFLLRKSLPPGSLAGMAAAVFGLGDSGYPKYNVCSKRLYRRLEGLGAQLVVPLGLGDDQHRAGYEAALDPWLAQLWAALRARFPLPAGVTEPPPDDTTTELVPKYRITYLPPEQWAAAAAASSNGSAASGSHAEEIAAARAFDLVEAAASGLPLPPPTAAQAQPAGGAAAGGQAAAAAPAADPRSAAAPATTAGPHGPGRPCFARLAVNRRITAPGHFQDTRHLELDLEGTGLSYGPGDVLAVVPRQPAAAVEALLARCGLDPQAWVRIEPADPAAAAAEQQQQAEQEQEQGPDATGQPQPPAAPLPAAVVRVGALVAGALDINGTSPRRFFFQVLRHFATAEGEAERLDYFCSAEGRDDLYAYNQREGRTVLEVLTDFKSAAVPLEWLLQTVPRLKPRLFSIASGPLLHPASVHLTVAVVEWATPYKRRRRGVCTSWLAGLDPAAGEVLLPVWVERGALRLPPSPATPLILVGPGTGVAPFRSFLQQRQALLRAGAAPAPAPCMLFFGCRNSTGDFYYSQEWEGMEAEGVLVPGGLVTAFSRDQPAKVYVTHRIRERAATLWALLQEQGAAVYVAGSADKMPAQVAAALEDVAVQAGGLSAEAAARWLRQLEAAGRYQVEAWS